VALGRLDDRFHQLGSLDSWSERSGVLLNAEFVEGIYSEGSSEVMRRKRTDHQIDLLAPLLHLSLNVHFLRRRRFHTDERADRLSFVCHNCYR
jgi:hypothetical protein